MSELLAEISDAHGGLRCWNGFEKVQASIVTSDRRARSLICSWCP
jgi:hypothetical protein